MRYPAVPLTLALIGGAVGGLFLTAPPESCAAVVWLGWVLAFTSLVQRECRAFVVTALLTALVCGWALGAAAARRASFPELRRLLTAARGPQAVGDEPTDPLPVVGRIREDVTVSGEGAPLALDLAAITIDGRTYPCDGSVLLTVAGLTGPEQSDGWRRGRLVRAPVLLRRPARYLNHGVPDHEQALLRRGVAMVGTVKSALLVEVVRRGHWLDEAAGTLRAGARRAIDTHVGRHDPRSAAIVRAIVIGDRAGLDDLTRERLQVAGTYHVIAISGGNIAILAGLVLIVLRLCAVPAVWRDLGACVLLMLYAWVVGGGASVSRATFMAVLLLIGRAIDYRGPVTNVLAVTAACGVALNPLSMFDPGAWLTFGATFAIVMVVAAFGDSMGRFPLPIRAAAGLLLASLAAEAALFPIGAYVFNRVTAAGLLLNFAAIPLMTVTQVGAMTLLAVAGLSPPAAGWAGYLTHLAAYGLVESARLAELAPWLSGRLPSPGPLELAVYYAGWLWYGLARLARRPGPAACARGAGMACIAGSSLWMLVAPVPPWRFPPDELRVLFIDVGQGDATLVRCPDGRALLVDAGGAGGSSFDIGRRVVEPAIWGAGVRRLTYLAVTHGDADHMNGAGALIRDLRPQEVWTGVPVPVHEPTAELRREADALEVGWRTLQRGDVLALGEVEVVVRHPPPAEWERQRVRNDDSLVLEIRYRGVSIVLPGDVEATGEASVAALLDRPRLRILQAPHHGSASSSSDTLLRAARPQVGIVSAGRGNRFGHPHRVVLQRFAFAGCPIFRTDRDGAIAVATDGRTVRVETFTGRRLTR